MLRSCIQGANRRISIHDFVELLRLGRQPFAVRLRPDFVNDGSAIILHPLPALLFAIRSTLREELSFQNR